MSNSRASPVERPGIGNDSRGNGINRSLRWSPTRRLITKIADLNHNDTLWASLAAKDLSTAATSPCYATRLCSEEL